MLGCHCHHYLCTIVLLEGRLLLQRNETNQDETVLERNTRDGLYSNAVYSRE